MTNCGAGTACCCTSLEVTGGSYSRTYRYHGGSLFTSDPASVSSFRLDEYEVTVGRFRQFVTAWNSGSGWLPAPGSGKHAHLNGGNGLANSASPGGYEAGWHASDDALIALTDTNLTCGGTTPGATWTSAAGSPENMPMTCASWYEAYAFCIWDGGFLPSEAEWGYAAAGGSEQRKFPWGGTPPGGESHYAIFGCQYPDAGYCTYDAGYIIRPGTSAPVGTPTLGAARWAQLDLAGNEWEWTLDVPAAFVSPCTDCAYLAVTPDGRMFRGGAWFNTTTEIMSSFRDYIDFSPPTTRSTAIGVRCARSP
jgi:sulfatase modifying factor 1